VEKEVNLLPLYAAMLVYTPWLEPRIFWFIIKTCKYNPLMYVKFAFELFKKIVGFVVVKFKYKFKMLPFKVFDNVNHLEVITVLKKNFKVNI
jgi:hypothetical protein